MSFSVAPRLTSARKEFLSGVRAELPILLGVAPFGMIYGVLALGAGLSTGTAQAMSSVVFAGSAQFMAVQLFGAGTPWAVMVLTIFVINLRHALYSASVAPYLRRLSPLWKGLLAYLLTDEAYAITITHYQDTGPMPLEADSHRDNRHWYFLGAGLALWTCWQISTAVGIFLGTQVPESWSLDFTLALTFIALVVPAIKDRAGLAAALAAGLVAVVAYPLPYKLGLIAAALAGIAAGLLVEGKSWRTG
jgi:4-azaleucine resistance transporter AzlC